MKNIKTFLAIILPYILGSSVGFCQVSPSTNKPYVRTSTPRIETNNVADLDDFTKTMNTIQYYDGSGSPMQSVGFRASPKAQDLISGTNTLDPIGRPKRTYLTVSSPLNTGEFQGNVPIIAKSFYHDSASYSEIETYEASPFSRAFKTVGVGQAYRTTTSKGLVQSQFTAGAGVRKYLVQEDNLGNVTLVTGSVLFADGDLIKTTIIDEDGNAVSEYKDKEGKTIEMRVKDHNSGIFELITAYVYDDVARLRYIIPPKAYNFANQFDETSTPNANYFEDQIYAFRYDERGRVVEKHTPGGGWTYTVYNELDQALMSQNPRQRETNLWLWVRYDGHGRTVMTGTWNNGSQAIRRDTLQNRFLNFKNDNQFEERSTAIGNLFGYTSRSFPTQINIQASDVMKADYFDDYSWVQADTTTLKFQKYKTEKWTSAKGLPTGNIVRKLAAGVPDDNSLLKSVMYYNDQNRIIQTKSQNRFGAVGVPSVNQTDYVLNFIGEVLEERTIYRKPSKPDLTVKTSYTYDHVGRIKGVTHQINKQAPIPLAAYYYDSIGRFTQKRLMQTAKDSIIRQESLINGQLDIANNYVKLKAGTYTADSGVYCAAISPNVLQVIDYTYNIRGQLRSLDSHANGSTSSLFKLNLDYFETGIYYNGKLQKQIWKSNGSSNQRGFTYAYDGFDRLQNATYTGVGNENYSMPFMSYDANGNLNRLQRNGFNGGTWTRIDDLTYTYANAGNKLQGIVDGSLANKGFIDNGNNNDYTYYSDGSLKTDANKGITNITYNFLGLPDRIEFGTSQRIENIYDAEGMKLAQKIVNGSTTIRTDYMGDLIYRNDSLKTIGHDEGRIVVDTAFHYQFFIADHLGNTRIIMQRLNDTTALVQENHYGAFGELLEEIGKTGDWKFLFQGNEWIDNFGYNTYDFNARQFDPYKAQFNSIDAVDNFSLGGTVGMLNQPTFVTDKSGNCPICVAIAIGAIVGGFTNGIIQQSKGGDFGSGFWKGAITGAIGGAFGGIAPTGVLGGAFAGTFGGVIAGGVGSTLNNGSFFDDFGSNALIGGVTGGIAGGIQANSIGAHTWTGEMPSYNDAIQVPLLRGGSNNSLFSGGGEPTYFGGTLDKITAYGQKLYNVVEKGLNKTARDAVYFASTFSAVVANSANGLSKEAQGDYSASNYHKYKPYSLNEDWQFNRTDGFTGMFSVERNEKLLQATLGTELTLTRIPSVKVFGGTGFTTWAGNYGINFAKDKVIKESIKTVILH